MMSDLQYTHKEMIKLCDEAKRMMISEFSSMIDGLNRDVSGQCVWVDEIVSGLDDIKEGNGLTTKEKNI